MFQRLRSMFLAVKRRRDFEDGMSEELRFHEQYAGDLMRSGGRAKKRIGLLAWNSEGSTA